MTTIQWFPGHMAKARREMKESLAKVDAVLELVDARLPLSSANPMLQELMERRPRVIVMTRIDMADPAQTALWSAHLSSDDRKVVAVDAKSGSGVHLISPALEEVAKEKRARDERRGIRPRPLRAMVVGIPNVGKSSLINRLAKRTATKTGDRPGITKTQQWIRFGSIDLLDTPGVLWPKFSSDETGYTLAVSGAIKDTILDLQSVSAYFVLYASLHYPQALHNRYQVDVLAPTAFTDAREAWQAAEPILEQIAKRRGLVRAGGLPDTERASELVLREAQTGLLGRMSFEWAEDVTNR